MSKAALTAAAELSEEAETRAFLPTVTRTSEEPLKYTVVSAITCAISRQMTKYIIGTISELDVPMNPSAKGQTSESAWFNGITEADFQQERDQILDATLDDIHALADLVDAALKQNNICVVGSEAAIQKEKELFKNVENL